MERKSGAMATEIKVLSSLATKEAYLELVPAFEHASGHKVATTWAGTVDIMKRMAVGEVFDLVISSANSLGELIKQGRIIAASKADLAKTGIGIAIRKGAPRPAIASAGHLKKALLAARTVGYSTGPSGVYLVGLFERMGIGAEVKAKTRQVPTGGTVASILASGEAEIGFQQISELHGDGIEYIGPLPAEVQNITVFSAGVHSHATYPAEARALVQFLTSRDADPAIAAAGLERP
jgi:molybdate transport system substrate-binding protein